MVTKELIAGIGGDQRRNGWQNNTFEAQINRDVVHTTGRFSTNF